VPRLIGTTLLVLLFPGVLSAQRPVPYPVTPPPEYQRAVQRGTRTTTGEPGMGYWQQWTDYTLVATLDPDAKRITGRAEIVYHNRSPNTLPTLFLQLDQNLHAPGAVRLDSEEVTGGIQIRRVVAAGRALQLGALDQGPAYEVLGTVMGVTPGNPVPPGGQITLEIEWAFAVPRSGAGRMGWNADNLFHIAYWYPQMSVYDDVVGWQTDAYTGNAEFYAGYGSYDVTVVAPTGWIISATGRLTNADEVLPDAVRNRLAAAERSDTVVHVVTADDLAAGRATRAAANGQLRWHFVADTVRDVAFSATRASRWDAVRTPVGDRDGDGQTDYARVDALWRASAPRWEKAWRYGQHAIAFHSRWTGLPYPWPHMTIVEGSGIIGGGMEFPMMTLIGDYTNRTDQDLYNVVAHELGHMWVPMLVSNDERRYGWMDEGTTTFNENQARKDFAPNTDPDGEEQQNYLGVARAGLEGEIMRWSDYHYPGEAYTTASYSKPATLLVALRAMLGEDTFVRAYRAFLSRWRYKEPKPWDFFDTFNSVSGQNLDWFWRTWYYETWTLDQAVASVTTGATGTKIVIEDRGWAPMPVRLTITRADGSVEQREIPVDVWLHGDTRTELTVEGASPVTMVEIDAERKFPDANRANNRWTAGGSR
jgi:Peptidase family M1 domain